MIFNGSVTRTARGIRPERTDQDNEIAADHTIAVAPLVANCKDFRMNIEATPIIVEQTFNAPADVVWKAITSKDQMCEWFFETMVEFRPEPGFETQFNVRCEDRDYLHLWKVTDVVPERRIAYEWRYGGYPGNSSVTWELSETPGGTSLRLTHEGHETFPQDDPVFSRESCQGAWDYFLRESLKAFLERQMS
jgi:uncharacterized protein YndB with AHSA1/START domain